MADMAMGHRVEWVAFWMGHLGRGSMYVHPWPIHYIQYNTFMIMIMGKNV